MGTTVLVTYLGAGRRARVPPFTSPYLPAGSVRDARKRSTVGAEPIRQSGSCISPAMPNRGDRIDSANNAQSIEETI